MSTATGAPGRWPLNSSASVVWAIVCVDVINFARKIFVWPEVAFLPVCAVSPAIRRRLPANGDQRRGPNTGESFHRQSGKVDCERRPTAGSKYRGVVSPAIKRRLTAIGGDEVGGAMASVAPESSWS